MHHAAARHPAHDFDISFEVFVDELTAALAAIVPQVRNGRIDAGKRFGRGSATADVTFHGRDAVAVVLRHGCERVLAASLPLTPGGLNDLAADLVGFFCGAPLVTLSIFPRLAPVAMPTGRRRRRGGYDAPLIPLPFDPPARTGG